MIRMEDVVAAARAWLGTPYHHQGCVKGVGCDCLGLIRGVYAELYGRPASEDVPPYTPDWAEARREETLLAAAARHLDEVPRSRIANPGDVLVFRIRDMAIAKHACILTEPGRMVHAQETVGCVEVSLSFWWLRRVAGRFRFPGVVI